MHGHGWHLLSKCYQEHMKYDAASIHLWEFHNMQAKILIAYLPLLKAALGYQKNHVQCTAPIKKSASLLVIQSSTFRHSTMPFDAYNIAPYNLLWCNGPFMKTVESPWGCTSIANGLSRNAPRRHTRSMSTTESPTPLSDPIFNHCIFS